jgi:hypothetical protein
MTTLQNRPNTALLVVDVQSGGWTEPRTDTVVANVGALVDKPAGAGPGGLVQHSSDMLEKGTEEWRIVPSWRRRRRAAGGEDLPGLVRGHHAGKRSVRPGRRRWR